MAAQQTGQTNDWDIVTTWSLAESQEKRAEGWEPFSMSDNPLCFWLRRPAAIREESPRPTPGSFDGWAGRARDDGNPLKDANFAPHNMRNNRGFHFAKSDSAEPNANISASGETTNQRSLATNTVRSDRVHPSS